VNWRSVSLGQAGTIVGGGTPSTANSKHFGDGYPWITPKDLSRQRSRFVRTGERSITDSGLRASSAKLLPSGTVILSSRAPIGLTAIAAVPLTTNQGCRSFVPGDEVDTLFMYYLLGSMKDEFERRANGSTFKEISGSTLSAIEVLLPPLAEQRGIAATLGALDDKIESNRRIITLVPNLISKHVLGALSEASDTISVSQLAYFINGGAYTKGATGYGRMVIRIAELNSGPGDSTVYNDLDVGENQLARPGDILMSWSGSLGLYRWFRDEAIINQHIFKVISWVYPDWLIFDRLQSVMGIFRGIAQDKATTMGHIQRGHLDSTTVMIPSEESIRALDQKLAPLWAKLLLAERENLKLAALRDALLPELLSGRIRVPEAQGAVEAVV